MDRKGFVEGIGSLKDHVDGEGEEKWIPIEGERS